MSGEGFVQGAVQHGLIDSLTVYAGAAVAPGYVSGLVGAALNSPLGAIALDATLSQARINPEDPGQGYSVRLSYSKVVPGILTNISVAAYRHSSGGFWSMQDAMEAREAGRRGLDPRTVQRQRDRFQINVSQNLGPGWGNLYLSGSTTSYWNRAGSVLQWGDLPQNACLLDYRLPPSDRGELAMLKVEALCIPRAVGAIAGEVPPHIDYLPL